LKPTISASSPAYIRRSHPTNSPSASPNTTAIPNPANALARIIGGLHDETGRIAIAGFYDDVEPPSAETLEGIRSLPFDAEALMNLSGRLSPRVRLVSLDHRARDAWRGLREGEPRPRVEIRHAPQQLDLVVGKRAIEDRDNRFRCVERQRPEACAESSGEQERFHDRRS